MSDSSDRLLRWRHHPQARGKIPRLVDEENGPICDDASELDPQAVGALGDFIGAQMAAANIGEVAAVPEPGTYAMFLAGLGIVGYRLRSRRKTAR